MRTFKEYDVVRLREPRSDIGTHILGAIVLVHDAEPGQYEVEFCNRRGETLALLTLREDEIESATPAEPVPRLAQMLQFPLYTILFEEDLASIDGLTVTQEEYWLTNHERRELGGIVKALAWANENPDFPFNNLLPGLQFSNEDLLRYFNVMRGEFQRLLRTPRSAARKRRLLLDDLEKRIVALIERLEPRLPRDQGAEMMSLAKAGEPGIALENLCTQLFEFDIAVPSDVVEELASLGQSMGIDPSHWRQLRVSND